MFRKECPEQMTQLLVRFSSSIGDKLQPLAEKLEAVRAQRGWACPFISEVDKQLQAHVSSSRSYFLLHLVLFLFLGFLLNSIAVADHPAATVTLCHCLGCHLLSFPLDKYSLPPYKFAFSLYLVLLMAPHLIGLFLTVFFSSSQPSSCRTLSPLTGSQ